MREDRVERRLLVATGNPGKVLELAELLRGIPFTLVSLRDLGLPTEIEETADTFEGNAVIKAETYARMSGLLTMADDSGLEVDALDGGARRPLEALCGRRCLRRRPDGPRAPAPRRDAVATSNGALSLRARAGGPRRDHRHL